MDEIIMGLLVIGTLGLFYVLVFQVALAAGKRYAENVRVPAIAAAMGILASGIVESLQLFGIIGNTTGYEIALSVSLAATIAAMWMLAIRL